MKWLNRDFETKRCAAFLEYQALNQKIHQDFFLPKECSKKVLAISGCRIVPPYIGGLPNGAKKQIRCPGNIHIRDYGRWKLGHIDCHDPNNLVNSFKHLRDDVLFGTC